MTRKGNQESGHENDFDIVVSIMGDCYQIANLIHSKHGISDGNVAECAHLMFNELNRIGYTPDAFNTDLLDEVKKHINSYE